MVFMRGNHHYDHGDSQLSPSLLVLKIMMIHTVSDQGDLPVLPCFSVQVVPQFYEFAALCRAACDQDQITPNRLLWPRKFFFFSGRAVR